MNATQTSATSVSFHSDVDGLGRTLETCYVTVGSDRYEFTSFNGGKIEAYRLEDGIYMFAGYRADAWVARLFADARAERARQAAIAERPLEF